MPLRSNRPPMRGRCACWSFVGARQPPTSSWRKQQPWSSAVKHSTTRVSRNDWQGMWRAPTSPTIHVWRLALRSSSNTAWRVIEFIAITRPLSAVTLDTHRYPRGQIREVGRKQVPGKWGANGDDPHWHPHGVPCPLALSPHCVPYPRSLQPHRLSQQRNLKICSYNTCEFFLADA